MGCTSGKEPSKPKPTNPEKRKKCKEIVDKLDADSNGRMSRKELQILVKHLYPDFINTAAEKIPLNPPHPKIQALHGKTKDELIKHLDVTCDITWVDVFHQFLGCGLDDKPFADTEEPTPGVYTVAWEGGVRYRNSPSYQDIADGEQLALPETEFEISYFKQGPHKVYYGYIHWARYWLPLTFQDGTKTMLKRIGDVGTSKQLEQLAEDLFREIDTSNDGFASWEEITSFLNGAEIAFNEEELRKDFDAADENNDNQLDLSEFINCYQRESIANVFCIPTKGRQGVEHPAEFQAANDQVKKDKFAMFERARHADQQKEDANQLLEEGKHAA